MRRVAATSRWPVTLLAVVIGSLLWASIVIVAVQRPILVLGTMFVLAGVVAVFRYPVLALGFLFFIQPINTAIFSAIKSHTGTEGGPLSYWKDAIIVALFARAFLQRVFQDRRLPFQNAGDNFVLFYILAFIAIAIGSPSRSTLFPALGLNIEGPLLFLAIRWLRPSRREVWFLVAAILAAATVMGAGALIEWFGPRLAFHRWYGAVPPPSGAPFVLPSGGYRAGSFITDPLILGFYAAATVAFATAMSAIRSQWRWAALVAVGACAGGLIVTLTRSGYIGGAIGVLIVLSLVVRNPGIRLSIVGIIVVIVGTISIYYVASNNQNLVRSESNSSHVEHLSRDVDLLVARPFGYGLGTTDRYRFRPNAGPGQLGATEDTYLARGLESGVQGLALYLVALFYVLMRLRAARLRRRRQSDLEGVALAVGAIGAIAAISIAGLFLGVQELVVEILLWGIPALALAWPGASAGPDEEHRNLEPGRSAENRSASTIAPDGPEPAIT